MTQREEELAFRAACRAETLKQSIEAEAEWERNPGRNLVLLFDGTGNVLGNSRDTNVVKLLGMLTKSPPNGEGPKQIAYYDPGVGTHNEFPPAGVGARSRGLWQVLQGLALGQGAFENVSEGYEFLCREYQPGDRIWLFGFSRGAFTARAVGGMVNMYGLVYPAGLPMVRTLVRTYFAETKRDSGTRKGAPRKRNTKEDRDNFAADVVKQFSLGRTPLIHFTGVWDTVETIGLTGGVSITNSAELEHKRFVHVRHALALHETRQKYKPREYKTPRFTEAEAAVRSFKQCWFRGVHSDIGGSYVQHGLSDITLNWMVQEARDRGLKMTEQDPPPGNPKEQMHDQALDSPYWILTGLDARGRPKDAPINSSALPIAEATPAQRTTTSWIAKYAGYLLAVVAAAMLMFTLQAGKDACNLDASPGWVALVPFAFQLLAPFRESLHMSCSEPAMSSAVWRDFFLLAAYWLWLPYPVAWAVRRWCAKAIAAGSSLPTVASKIHIGLWLVLLSDLLENILTLHHFQSAWLAWFVMLFFVVKLLGFLWIIFVFVAGALSGQRPNARSRSGGDMPRRVGA